MIAIFEERRTTVRALQLTPETADELCRWTLGYRLGPDRWVPSEGCWRRFPDEFRRAGGHG